jgi:hypothetical protein
VAVAADRLGEDATTALDRAFADRRVGERASLSLGARLVGAVGDDHAALRGETRD